MTRPVREDTVAETATSATRRMRKMSVLIKGMGMPGNCAGCFMRFSGCEQRIYQDCRPKGCPLVEVPKHGRLIDADALNFSSMLDSIDQGIAEETVMDAPTIIEAEE